MTLIATLIAKPDTVDYDLTSRPVHISLQERLGHGVGIQLRRHKNEAAINRATHSARRDWRRYIGPIDTFGNANPYHGSFVSLVLPFTLPDRVAVLAYLIECQSLHIGGSMI
jgi:ophiobolin F synthase